MGEKSLGAVDEGWPEGIYRKTALKSVVLHNKKTTGGGEDVLAITRGGTAEFIYHRGVRYRGRPTTSSVDWGDHGTNPVFVQSVKP